MRLLVLVAGVLGNLICSSRAETISVESLKLFATPLPAHFGVFELIEGLELRLYLPENEATVVRVTPTCAGVSFEPSFVLFDETVSVASGIVAQANVTGDLQIEYVATVEGSSSENAVLFSQSVTVLPAPIAYAVDANNWKGVILQKDSFDDTPLTSSFWSEQQHGYSSNACGSFDGSNSLFFTSLGDRLALTAPLELEGFHGKMHFYHVYGFEAVQKYDSKGDNRVACEMTDIDEEVLFGYLPRGANPLNVSTWQEILEIPLPPSTVSRSSNFAPFSVILPPVAMHQGAQFYWMQKTHSSFPIDVATGLTRDQVIAAENDPTGVQGQMGTQERELWKYRNLFDQWAIDDVRLELLTAGNPEASLTCSSGSLYQAPVEVGKGISKLVAVSCLAGLKMSDTTEIVIGLDNCCSGRTAYLQTSCAHVLLLQDDFNLCPGNGGAGNVQTNTNWQLMTSQWGGTDVNGGVHSDNVRCVADAVLGKNVLELTANGDLFDGVVPVGKTMMNDGSTRDRTTDDRFMEWALDGISPLSCNPLEHCPARRVGAAVKSVLHQNAGVMVIRIKPCSAFGTLTQVWWGNYEDVDTSATSEEKEIPFLPLWKSALYQAKTTPGVPFTLTSPQPTDDSAYTEIVMQWDASAARTNLYVDGQLVLKQMGMEALSLQSDASSSLSIGVWFPNAVAGEPLFPSCKTYVDKVQVFDLQITGGRWCDFEDVVADVIPCTEDADCEEWVQINCFMDIYEAVCTDHRVSDTDDGSSSNSTAKFCQFRLQPTAQTSVSTTAMTNRELEMQWGEDEEPKQA
ncbi:hypothetical protein PRIC2_009552 [Phytophthora ramorum]